MWTLDSPENTNAKAELQIALTLANGTAVYSLTTAESQNILGLYAAYDEALGRPAQGFETPQDLGKALLDAVHDAYSQVQKGARLATLRGRLIANADRCPYCGINAVTDLDHHLPKARFRVFSIYCRNLVPSCGTCNNKKRSHTGANPDEEFVHVYLEDLGAAQFFKATAAMVDDALTVNFEIDTNAGLEPSLATRLQRQLTHLALNDRYVAEINILLSPFAGHLEDLGPSPASASLIANFLLRSAETSARQHGDNDWRPVVLSAIANSSDFCSGGFRTALGAAIKPAPAQSVDA
jgi:hypothetical protein